MRQNECSQLALRLGYKRFGTVWCGVKDGWPVTLSAAGFTVPVDWKEAKPNLSAAKAEIKAMGGRLARNTVNGLTTLRFTFPKSADAAQYLDGALRAVRRTGIRPLDTCPLCRSGSCDTAAAATGGFRAVHRHCLHEAADKTAASAEKNANSGSYVTGIIGALLGMVVGTIPSLLTILAADTIYAILFALIPICAYLGYKLLGGRMNKFALVTSIVAAILGVFLINYELLVYYIVTDYGYSVGEAISFVASIALSGDVLSDIISSSGVEFFFTLLGLFFSWRLITRTASGAAASAKNVLESSVPLHGTEIETPDFADYEISNAPAPEANDNYAPFSDDIIDED